MPLVPLLDVICECSPRRFSWAKKVRKHWCTYLLKSLYFLLGSSANLPVAWLWRRSRQAKPPNQIIWSKTQRCLGQTRKWHGTCVGWGMTWNGCTICPPPPIPQPPVEFFITRYIAVQFSVHVLCHSNLKFCC